MAHNSACASGIRQRSSRDNALIKNSLNVIKGEGAPLRISHNLNGGKFTTQYDVEKE